MDQILHNLLHNALQHTPEKAVVKIDLSHTAMHCIITVSDNGNGFPENEIDFVFDKFYRLRRSAAGGTGLGLSIVKGFAEAMNGKVSLENLPQGGAKFTVEIPCAFSLNNVTEDE